MIEGTGFWNARSVLVTGGAGFIGSHLAERLVEKGARVRVVDNLARGRLENLSACLGSVEFWHRDLADAHVAFEACREVDTVFHLAAKVGGIGYYLTRPGEVITHNMLVDSVVLQAAARAGVQRFVYASSGFVYPLALQKEPDAPALREEDAVPADPAVSYGWAKLAGERALEYEVAEGSIGSGVILRVVGAFGPRQDIDLEQGSVIPVFIRRAIEYPERYPFVIKGSGIETRTFCYVDDVIEAFLQAAEVLPTRGFHGPFNVGSEERTTIKKLADMIVSLSGKEIVVQRVQSSVAILHQVMDCTRARTMLGWYSRTSLEEGLKRTYADVEERLRREIGKGTAHEPTT